MVQKLTPFVLYDFLHYLVKC